MTILFFYSFKRDSNKLETCRQIRRHWDGEKELWYFSIIDVARVLTGSVDAGAYWRKLKQRLKEDGNEVVTKCHKLKMLATDGKYYDTDGVLN